MKITKSKLKQIIKEEIDNFNAEMGFFDIMRKIKKIKTDICKHQQITLTMLDAVESISEQVAEDMLISKIIEKAPTLEREKIIYILELLRDKGGFSLKEVFTTLKPHIKSAIKLLC